MCATVPRSLVLVTIGTPHSLTHSLTHSLARSLASPSLGGARSPWTTGPSSMAASRASSHRRPSSRPFCVLRRASKLPQPDAPSLAGHLRPPCTRGAGHHCRQVKLRGRHPRSSFEPPPSQLTSLSTSPLRAASCTPPSRSRSHRQPSPPSSAGRRATVRVVAPTRAASGRAELFPRCALTPWFSPATPPPPPALLRPPPADSPASSVLNCDQGPRARI